MKHTISVLVENKFGTLARIAGMFSGRGFNINSLNVAPTQNEKYSRLTVTVIAQTSAELEQCIKQLQKLINVIEVEDFSSEDFMSRELLMLKIQANDETRSKIVEIADIFEAKIIHANLESLTLECTGNQKKIETFLNMLSPFTILELARTGSLAMKGD